MQVVMGIDPGAANLGFGVVRVEGNRMVALDGGVVETSPDQPLEQRLERIHSALSELVEWHEPRAMALEDLYFGKNVHSAMAVGRASGAAMLAAAQCGVRCFTYTPQAIKMAVCGSGGGRQAAGAAHGRHACSVCPSHLPPITPPTPWLWRSATAAPPAAKRRSRRPRAARRQRLAG